MTDLYEMCCKLVLTMLFQDLLPALFLNIPSQQNHSLSKVDPWPDRDLVMFRMRQRLDSNRVLCKTIEQVPLIATYTLIGRGDSPDFETQCIITRNRMKTPQRHDELGFDPRRFGSVEYRGQFLRCFFQPGSICLRCFCEEVGSKEFE